MDELRFEGRVAVVTGAGRGIGRAHALLLAARGASVVVSDLGGETSGAGNSTGPADAVVEEILAAGGTAVANHTSVAEEVGAQSIVDTAIDTFGRLDIVVNNAGIFAPAPFEALSSDQFRAMMDVHFFGTLFVTKSAWPHLTAAGYGRIVNTISEAILGMAQMASYGAAKAAILGLTRTIAAEGELHGIQANCIAPRAGTRMFDDLGAALSLPPEAVDQLKASMPPEIVAPAAAYLAHESCALNGEVLQVSPGRISRLAIVHTKGFSMSDITAEDIAANLKQVMDVTDANVTDLSDVQAVLG